MDFQNDRDLKFLFLLGFILVSLKPLYNIDFYWMIPTLICFTGLWWALLDALPAHSIRSKPRFLMRLFISAIPLTIALFILFPRFVVPWAQSQAKSSGQMGFSDELNPGQVAELASTKSLVFRARFTDNLQMKTKSMYWRGAVLKQSKGLAWRTKKSFSSPPADSDIRTSQIHYEILLEPSDQSYLFGLEKTLDLNTNSFRIKRSEDSVFRSELAITRPLSYEGYSSPLGHHQDPPSTEDLEVPNLPEKTSKWVDRVNSQFKDKSLRLKELQRLFSDRSFAYSLKPGSYPENGLDQFLFQRRLGFCEHFAGAYATLARALGVPSRVITGFHGGLYNAFGGFWRVTTHDAHAWVEVYLQNQWERIDPVDWVAPLRLEIGAEAFFEIPEEEQRSWTPGQYHSARESSWLRWVDFASNQVEFLNYRWTQFLIEFDRDSQNSLWSNIKDNWGWVTLSILLISMVLAALFKALGPSASKQDQLSDLYQELFAWGQKNEMPLEQGETPFTFTHRLENSFPHRTDLRNYLDILNQRYDEAIYQEKKLHPPELYKLKKSWRQLRKIKLNDKAH